MRSIAHWSPRYIVDRIALRAFELRNPSAPWLTARMVAILDSWLRRSDLGLEFGSGRSTSWIAARVGRLISVEHDSAWQSKVLRTLGEAGLDGRVDYRLSGAGVEQQSATEYLTVIKEIPTQSLDFCLVDGRFRDECAVQALDRVRRGGVIVVDNANWYIPRENPSTAPYSRKLSDGYESEKWREFGLATNEWRHIWTTNGVTDTAMFVKP